MRFASFLRPLLAIVLSVAAVPAAAQLNPIIDLSEPIHVVYRVEATPSPDAFRTGFNAAGTNRDLLSLTSGVACADPNDPSQLPAWVTMTADHDQAILFAHRYLGNAPWRIGGNRPQVTVYAIRADASFISVPGAFYSAIDAAFAGRAGYQPQHQAPLNYLLHARLILGERTVVASHVPPVNIRSATGYWLQNGNFRHGPTIPNGAYVHDAPSAATAVVPDLLLPGLLPPSGIQPAMGAASGSCAMVCNAPVWSSSFSSNDGIDRDTLCSVSDAISPLLFDIIND